MQEVPARRQVINRDDLDQQVIQALQELPFVNEDF
jgi:hypothetical protein